MGKSEGNIKIRAIRKKGIPTHPAPLPVHIPDASADNIQATSTALKDILTTLSGVANAVTILRTAIDVLGDHSQSKARCKKN